MIHTALFKLDTSDTQWDVAHLFEHLVIETFYSELKHQDINPEHIGWIVGDTFEDVMFIDVGFYNQRTLELFSKHLSALPIFSNSTVSYCIKAIQTEDRKEITVKDADLLNSELKKLSGRTWNTTINLPDEPVASPLQMRSNIKQFREIIIETHAHNLTDDEQKLFLRFRTILIDITHHVLAEIPELYSRGHSASDRNNDHMGIISHYTLARKSFSLKEIHTKLQETYKSYDVPVSMPALRDHFNAFAHESLWLNIPIEYYRTTGLITTTKEISKLATKDAIKSLISKLSFVVRDYSEADSDFIE